MRIHRLSRGNRRGVAQPARLQEEIATLQQRLDQIGPEGDCGYEKAMIRFFQQQIAMRREVLLHTGPSQDLISATPLRQTPQHLNDVQPSDS